LLVVAPARPGAARDRLLGAFGLAALVVSSPHPVLAASTAGRLFHRELDFMH
jgi:hypothetical protein